MEKSSELENISVWNRPKSSLKQMPLTIEMSSIL